MCLAIPARIVRIDGVMATADVDGMRRQVSLARVDGIAIGDYVVVHLGYALHRIHPEDAELALQMFRDVAGRACVSWPEQRR